MNKNEIEEAKAALPDLTKWFPVPIGALVRKGTRVALSYKRNNKQDEVSVYYEVASWVNTVHRDTPAFTEVQLKPHPKANLLLELSQSCKPKLWEEVLDALEPHDEPKPRRDDKVDALTSAIDADVASTVAGTIEAPFPTMRLIDYGFPGRDKMLRRLVGNG